MSDFVRLQDKELDVRLAESLERKENIAANKEIALRSIDAQKDTDRISAEIFKSVNTTNKLVVVALSFITAVVICIAILYDKESIALEIVKCLAFLIAGYVGGKYRGAYLQEQKQKHENSKSAHE